MITGNQTINGVFPYLRETLCIVGKKPESSEQTDTEGVFLGSFS